MISKQKTIDFEVHLRENNLESEQHLYNNKEHFSKQCRELFTLLMSGKRLTTYSALVDHHIGHIARRALDLKQAGVQLMAEPMLGTRIKEWYMNDSQIEYNKKFL